MGKHRSSRFELCFLLVAIAWGTAFGADAPDIGLKSPEQNEFERSVQAVVRNKNFYKSGRFEVTGMAGIMPYDSLQNHYMVGGRLAWHLSDHYGWEILDAVLTFPSVTSYTQSTVANNNLTNLQTNRINMMFATNFLVSPIYGKIRFFAHSVLHFDVYLVAGAGFAKNDVVQYAESGANNVVETNLGSNFDPMFVVGLGFKMFLNNAMGLTFDLRDYVIHSTTYGSKKLGSNYSVFVGLTFFVPTFGG